MCVCAIPNILMSVEDAQVIDLCSADSYWNVEVTHILRLLEHAGGT